MTSPRCKEELLFKYGGKPMKKEWRLYRLQLDKTYLMYFQLDECNEPKHKILRSKIISATTGEVRLIKKVNRFTFVVNFSDDTPSWNFAADTEEVRQEWIRVLNERWSLTRAASLMVASGKDARHKALPRRNTTLSLPATTPPSPGPACALNMCYGSSLRGHQPKVSTAPQPPDQLVARRPPTDTQNPSTNSRDDESQQSTAIGGTGSASDRPACALNMCYGSSLRGHQPKVSTAPQPPDQLVARRPPTDTQNPSTNSRDDESQ
ncbi:hypothetical protein EMCRGX_G008034 [Ephydatia muelleri]